MTTEQIVERYQYRSGYRLADYAEVGLPVYALNVEAITIAHKRIAPIDEFVLRALATGMSSIDEVSAFLGLDREMLLHAFANLAQTENIALTATAGRQAWVITTKGKTALEAAETVAPEERTFPIHFDAILRRPTLFRFQPLLKQRALREKGIIEIEHYPPKRPQLAEVSPEQLERILRGVPSPGEQRRDVLAVRSLENVRKSFVRAVALVFKSEQGSGTQVSFILDGRLSAEHELAFARSEGFKRLVDAIDRDPVERQEIKQVSSAAESAVGVEPSTGHLEASTAQAEATVAEVSQALRICEEDEGKRILQARLAEAQDALVRLQAESRQLPVRNLYVLDHPPLLEDALVSAQERLLIISPWITAAVVNEQFLRKLQSLLVRGITVYVGYGMPQETTKDRDKKAHDQLRELAGKHANFHFRRLGDTHAKVLIKDREFAAVTSFNWLSFKGDPGRPFRDEQGIVLQRPELVEQKFNELVGRFPVGAPAT